MSPSRRDLLRLRLRALVPAPASAALSAEPAVPVRQDPSGVLHPAGCSAELAADGREYRESPPPGVSRG